MKVCDFGLSKVVRKGASKEKDAEALGSPQYAAPELSREDHNNRVDVFSFGVMYAAGTPDFSLQCFLRAVFCSVYGRFSRGISPGLRSALAGSSQSATRRGSGACWRERLRSQALRLRHLFSQSADSCWLPVW